MQKRTIIIIAVYVIMNIVSFLLMLIDKQLAKKGKTRIPEPVLLGVSACFGGLGGMIAMDVLKQKRSHCFRSGCRYLH